MGKAPNVLSGLRPPQGDRLEGTAGVDTGRAAQGDGKTLPALPGASQATPAAASDQPQPRIFASHVQGLRLTLHVHRTVENGAVVVNEEAVRFEEGVYYTSDPHVIAGLEKHKAYQRQFWDADARKRKEEHERIDGFLKELKARPDLLAKVADDPDLQAALRPRFEGDFSVEGPQAPPTSAA